MTISIAIAFVAATALLALTPGPNMSLIIANTLAGGMRAGYMTLAGSMTGAILLVTAAALGTTSVMVYLAKWFDWLRWIGALYLIVLGTLQFRQYWRRRGDPDFHPPAVSAKSAYVQGLLVSLSNPKVLLFLIAFFPQFVDPAHDPGPQLALLSVLFISTLAVIDISYTYALGRARSRFAMRKLAVLDGLAGALLIAGGIVLAASRRP
jgi:threonine/homoserine/homoserine lactone efflux protein